jgi:hypothetical protein
VHVEGAALRLHDLRHGAASRPTKPAPTLKTLQDLLGDSSIVVTADTSPSPPFIAR